MFHGDFLGAKALMGAVVAKDGLRIGITTTHLHAEYDCDNDEYLAHRVSQVITNDSLASQVDLISEFDFAGVF